MTAREVAALDCRDYHDLCEAPIVKFASYVLYGAFPLAHNAIRVAFEVSNAVDADAFGAPPVAPCAVVLAAAVIACAVECVVAVRSAPPAERAGAARAAGAEPRPAPVGAGAGRVQRADDAAELATAPEAGCATGQAVAALGRDPCVRDSAVRVPVRVGCVVLVVRRTPHDDCTAQNARVRAGRLYSTRVHSCSRRVPPTPHAGEGHGG